MSTAHELGRQLFTLADSTHDPQWLVESHYALGATLFFQGEVASARTHLEQGAALYAPAQPSAHARTYGQDPGVFCRVVGALALWVLGYAEQALGRTTEGLALSHQLGHANSHAGALFFAAWLHEMRCEGAAARVQAAAVRAFSAEQGFSFWGAWGTILEGCVLAEHGQEGKGVEQIRQGLTDLQATGAVLAQPYILTRLGEASTRHGQPEEGQTLVTEAVALLQRTGERWCEAEVERLRGELALQRASVHRRGWPTPKHARPRKGSANPSPPSPPPAGYDPFLEAESYFDRAIEIAQKQEAKSLELRATMSLARLWQQQGKRTEAYRMLSEIYNWFTEGFDTKDLQEAKVLLADLAAPSASLS